LKQSKKDIVEILQELKFDKMKLVREATNEALQALKDVPDTVVAGKKVKEENKSEEVTPKQG
jgi:hypothetical protein